MMDAPPDAPRTVAILGASADRSKFGNKSVRAHAAAGYRVIPVNPKGGVIEGLPVCRNLTEMGAPPRRISAYLPPGLLLEMLDEIAAVGCQELWLNPGCDTAAVVARCRELGIPAIAGCSIVDLGFSPAEFSDG
jgi:uncharacterized protein